jgi:hypothetical protein
MKTMHFMIFIVVTGIFNILDLTLTRIYTVSFLRIACRMHAVIKMICCGPIDHQIAFHPPCMP